MSAASGGDRSPWLTRPVLLAGLALGTFVTASAVYGGARPHLTSLPLFLPLVFGVLAELLAVIAVATVLAALLRRYHRTLLSGAWRHGKQAGAATFRASCEHGGSLRERLTAWANPRWNDRHALATDGQAPEPPRGKFAAWLRAADLQLNDAQRQRDADGKGNLCAACGHPGTVEDPLLIADGWRVHASHTTDPQDGFHDPAAQPPAGATAPAGNRQEGTTPMTTPTRTTPPGWKTLTTDTADFEPDDDGHLLEWMAAQVAGMLGYGEAVASVHEHCVSAVRLDPAAMATLHDVADAVADAAEAMARAIDKFKQVYEGPREFVSDGGVLPRSGDFLTGDGD